MKATLRGIRKGLSLTPRERGLLLRAFVALGRTHLELRVFGLQGMLVRIETANRRINSQPGAEDVTRAREYARWLDVASHHHVIPAHCLHRSLALHRRLRQESLPSRLRIGVRKEGEALKAHAWVELGAAIVNDQPETVAAFQSLGSARTIGRAIPSFGRDSQEAGSNSARWTSGLVGPSRAEFSQET